MITYIEKNSELLTYEFNCDKLQLSLLYFKIFNLVIFIIHTLKHFIHPKD